MCSRWLIISILAVWLGLLGGCGTSTGVEAAGSAGLGAAGQAGRLPVVAAESFWGSIARQLGGEKVWVRSLIVNPNVDPHSYEPAASDAIALAQSRMAIVNGIGYDQWVSRLLAADGSPSRVVLNVGDTLGLHQGDNPHQWYSPRSVQRVVGQIVADFQRLDPKDARYFKRLQVSFETQGLSEYRRLISEIRARYAGVPVGYSESIFEPLGRALGLKLMTPYSFAKAIAEGTDVTAADIQTVDGQAQHRLIKVWIFNSQNVTPEVQRVNQLARAAHIPITTITETPSRPSERFQEWQAAQLLSLRRALRKATGR